MGHSISDIDLIIHILHNLPEEYETTIELLENDLENELASLDRVKEKLRGNLRKFRGKEDLKMEHLWLAGEIQRFVKLVELGSSILDN